MIRYILRATASRKAEALVVATLAALLAAVVAAAPWYAADRGVQAATAGLRQTAAGKAVVSGERILAAGEKPDTARRDAERELAAVNLPRSRIVSAVQADGQSTTESRPAGVARLNSQLVARSDVCAEVAVRGRCPQTSGEAMIPAELAAELSVDVGGTILFSESNPNRAARLTVTGIYRILDPQARYWAGRFPDRARRERLILVAQTDLFEAAGARTPQLVVDLVPGDDMFAHVTPAEAIERLDSAPLALSKLEYTTPLRDFAVTLRDRQDALWQGMLVVAGEIVIFSWLVLFLVLRQMSWQHRTDLGTLKLRGIGSWRTISLTVGRHFSGLAAGAVAGTLAAWAFGFEPMSLVLVATVFAGSCLAGLIAERWSLRADVLHLLRSVPRGHGGIVLSGLRSAVVAAAVAGVVLARDAPGLVGQVAPALLALAIGVLVGEAAVAALRWVGAQRLRRSALVRTRGGVERARGGVERARGTAPVVALAAHWHGRRPALLRANAILTVTVAMAATATGAFLSSERAQRERAYRELGADRVVTVAAATNAGLLAAVRAADPSGTRAMAVVRHPDAAFLTVDSARLGAVARWPHAASSRPVAELAAALRPPSTMPLPALQGTELNVEAHRNDAGTGPIWLRFEFVDAAGAQVLAAAGPVTPQAGAPRAGGPVTPQAGAAGPVTPQAGALRVAVPGCAQGCRLRAIALRTDAGEFSPDAPAGTDVTLSASNVDIPLTDRSRWRSPLTDPPTLPLTVGAGPAGLRLAVPEGRVDQRALPDPGIDRLPVLVGGEFQVKSAAPESNVFPAVAVPIEPVGGTDIVPGEAPSGLVADLELADRFGAGVVGPEIQEVWLAPGAGDEMVEALRRNGLLVLGQRDAAARAGQWASQVEPGLIRYRLMGWWLVVLTCVVALLVLLVGESAELSVMLKALREQGFPLRSARMAAVLILGAPVVASAVAGLLTAILARPPLLAGQALFDDDWKPLPSGVPADLLTSIGGVLVAAALLAVAAAIANRRLGRRLGLRLRLRHGLGIGVRP